MIKSGGVPWSLSVDMSPRLPVPGTVSLRGGSVKAVIGNFAESADCKRRKYSWDRIFCDDDGCCFEVAGGRCGWSTLIALLVDVDRAPLPPARLSTEFKCDREYKMVPKYTRIAMLREMVTRDKLIFVCLLCWCFRPWLPMRTIAALLDTRRYVRFVICCPTFLLCFNVGE